MTKYKLSKTVKNYLSKIKAKQTEYDICKQACKEAGCYLPPEHVFCSTVAQTPMYIRAYFILKGKMYKEDLEAK